MLKVVLITADTNVDAFGRGAKGLFVVNTTTTEWQVLQKVEKVTGGYQTLFKVTELL